MIPPGLGPATSPARSPVLILRNRRRGIRLTGKPARLHLPHVGCHGLGFLGLRCCIGLCLLVRELTRMDHDKTQRLHAHPSIAVLDLDLPHDALPMPAAGRFSRRPPRFLYQEGQGGLLLPPGFECLTHGAGARH